MVIVCLFWPTVYLSDIIFPYISPACPTMRGSTPLDVAASSVMDNNSLALALEEPDLEKVTFHVKNEYNDMVELKG